MNIHVIYFSKSGHSRTLAQAVAKALSLEAMELTQVPADLSSDLVFLVTGIYGGVPDPKVKEFAGGAVATIHPPGLSHHFQHGQKTPDRDPEHSGKPGGQGPARRVPLQGFLPLLRHGPSK